MSAWPGPDDRDAYVIYAPRQAKPALSPAEQVAQVAAARAEWGLPSDPDSVERAIEFHGTPGFAWPSPLFTAEEAQDMRAFDDALPGRAVALIA